MVEEKFYQDVADLLGIKNEYKYNRYTVGGTYRTRWNNRAPGNGRFEGYGLVRMFSVNHIHIALTNPFVVQRYFTSTDEALDFLRNNI